MKSLQEINKQNLNKEGYFSKDTILHFIYNLSQSQGFYSRLYNILMELKDECIEDYNEIMDNLENQKFKDVLDIVFYFEC